MINPETQNPDTSGEPYSQLHEVDFLEIAAVALAKLRKHSLPGVIFNKTGAHSKVVVLEGYRHAEESPIDGLEGNQEPMSAPEAQLTVGTLPPEEEAPAEKVELAEEVVGPTDNEVSLPKRLIAPAYKSTRVVGAVIATDRRKGLSLRSEVRTQEPPHGANPAEQSTGKASEINRSLGLSTNDEEDRAEMLVKYLRGETETRPSEYDRRDLQKAWTIVDRSKDAPRGWQTRFVGAQPQIKKARATERVDRSMNL